MICDFFGAFTAYNLKRREDPGPESRETAVQIDDQQFHFQDGGRDIRTGRGWVSYYFLKF